MNNIEKSNEEIIDQNSDQSKNNLIEIVSKDKLLEAGVYFGHKTSAWNPKMKPYIHSKKMDTHIIDIAQTKKAIEIAYKLIEKFAAKGASFIFVGTKKQAKDIIKAQAVRTHSAYVSERWLGGTLTNNKTILSRVKKLEKLEELEKISFEGYTKKEGVEFTKELAKLKKNLEGIRDMKRLPQVMIVVDPLVNAIAIKEARKKGIKIIGLIDTNSDPSMVDLGIPANDDSVKSINLIITILADAISSAKNGEQLFAYQPAEKVILTIESQEKRPFNPNYKPMRRDYKDRNDRGEYKPRGERPEFKERGEYKPRGERPEFKEHKEHNDKI